MANWNIQSISYPNPFGERETEWAKLEEFVEFESYAQAREVLTPPEHKKTTVVETMKAAYESFGLLWVDGDTIRVTPGGRQYIDAVREGNEKEAAWIGLNLLLRCPLTGPRGKWVPRDSDLPIYWGILAVMLEAGGELYWEELGRALAWVTAREDLRQAVDTIEALRDGSLSLSEVEAPGDHHHGDLYNRLNMAMYHIGLGRMLTEKVNDDRYVGQGGKPRVDRIRGGWQRQLIETALGGASCDGLPTGGWVDRVPAALDAAEVEERFAILGAAVPPPQSATKVASTRLGGDMTWMVDPAQVTVAEMRITGPPTVMCGMAAGHRVALRGEGQRTFIVKDKQLAGEGVQIDLRPARRISDPARVEKAFEEIYGA
jgi:hypothetical protein